MSRNPALVLVVALGLIIPAKAFAQLTPPAGSAGAGNAPISGVPFGPANPRALSDPSGIGNAANTPPLRSNPPPPTVSYGTVESPAPRARLAILSERTGVFRCRTTFNCTDACPRGIEVTKAIQEVKRAILFDRS